MATLLEQFWARGKAVGICGALAGVSVWVRMASSSVGGAPEGLAEYTVGSLLASAGCGVLGLLYANVCIDLQQFLCATGKAYGDDSENRVRRSTRLLLCGSTAGAAVIIWARNIGLVVSILAVVLALGPMLSMYVAGKSCGRPRLAKVMGVLILIVAFGVAALALIELYLLARS